MISTANIKKEVDADPIQPPPTSFVSKPPKIDQRKIKTEAFETTLRQQKRVTQASRPRPWICALCRIDMYPSPISHYKSRNHKENLAVLLIDTLPWDIKEVNIQTESPLTLEYVKQGVQNLGQVVKIVASELKNSYLVTFANSSAISRLKGFGIPYLGTTLCLIRQVRPTTLLLLAGRSSITQENKLHEYHKELKTITQRESFPTQVELLVQALEPSEDECQLMKSISDEVCLGYGGTPLFSGLEITGTDVEVIIPTPDLKSEEEEEAFLEELKTKFDHQDADMIVDKDRLHLAFIHVATGYRVVVKVNDFFAMQNTLLQNVYMNNFKQLKMLAAVVQYWALRNALVEECNITRECLLALLYYYLQQLPTPLLPTPMAMQEQSPQFDLDGWECSVPEHFTPPSTVTNYTHRQLISGFFAFYANFNFRLFVIFPYIGQHLRKRMFANLNELPPGLGRYRELYMRNRKKVKDSKLEIVTSKTMCVQDPLELSRNLAAGVTQEGCQRFQDICEYTRLVFDDGTRPMSWVLLEALTKPPDRYFRESKRKTEDAEASIVSIDGEDAPQEPPEVIDLIDDDEDVEEVEVPRAPSTSASINTYDRDTESDCGYQASETSDTTIGSVLSCRQRYRLATSQRQTDFTVDADDEDDDDDESFWIDNNDDNVTLSQKHDRSLSDTSDCESDETVCSVLKKHKAK